MFVRTISFVSSFRTHFQHAMVVVLDRMNVKRLLVYTIAPVDSRIRG